MAFRTKKISQMDPKGANLASTDLLEISELVSGSYVTKSITGAEIISGATTGFVPTSRTLTINGTTQDLSADRTFTISTGITIGTTAITSGTVGRVLFEGTGNVVSESANLFWDNTNGRFQVGTSSTSPFGSPLIFMGKDQNGETNFQISNSTNGTGATVGFRVFGANSRSTFLGEFSQGHTGVTEFASNYVIEPNAPNIKHGLIISLPETTTGSDFMIYTGGRSSANRKLTLFGTTGNLAINTTTDAGFKLDVNGTARVQGTITSNVNYGLNVQPTSASVFSAIKITNNALSFEIGKDNNTGTAYGTGAWSANFLLPDNAHMVFWTNSLQRMRITNTGNLLINTTTDAGFKLDVNGTARVSGELAVSAQTGSGGINSIRSYNNDLSIATGWYFRLRIINDSNAILLGTEYDGAQTFLYSQRRIVLGNTSINSSAIIQADSTTRGFLPPRMTTTQKNAIASPATGLQIYDSTLNRPCFYDGTSWITL